MDAKKLNPKESYLSANNLPFGSLTVDTEGNISFNNEAGLRLNHATQRLKNAQTGIRDITERKERELSYEKLKKRVLPILDKLHGMVYLCNFDEQLAPEYISHGAKQLTGYAPAEFLKNPGLLFGGIIHPGDKRKIYDKISSAINKGNDFSIKYRIITVDGTEKYVVNHGRLIKNNDSPVGIEGLIEDITKERILKEKLQHKLKLEKTISNITSNFIGLININDAINLSFAEIGKITNADRIYLFLTNNDGKTADNTHEWCAPGVIPHKAILQDLPIELFPWWTKKVLNNEIIQIENVSLLPEEANSEKRLLEIQGIKSLIALPLNLNKTLKGFVGFDYVNDAKTWNTEDITILKTLVNIFSNALLKDQSEKNLLNSEKKLRSLFEDDKIPKVLIDPETGDIIDANHMAFEILGRDHDELIKMNLREISTSSPAEILNRLEEIKSNKNLNHIFRARLQDGSFKYIEASSSMIGIDNKKIIHSIFHDITESKKNYQELIQAKKKAEESDRLKSSFLATINHELRTPLNSVIGFSEIIRETTSEPETAKSAKIIYDSGLDLLEIINDIIDLSVIDNFKIKLRPEAFKLELMFDILKKQLRELLINAGKENQIALESDADPAILGQTIVADKGKIIQIMLNLSKNAVKFTELGMIKLGFIQRHKGEFSFYIKDSGIGISKNQQKVIFDIFRQVDDTLNRKYDGVGIGLAISNKIAHALKGKISVKSTLGKGSTFTLTIPAEISNDRNITDTKSYSGTPDLTGFSILVVDDESSNLLLVEKILRPAGATVFKAKNGKEAIDIFEKAKSINLVLMDMKMPVINGMEATKTIKANYNNIPVIALTAYPNEEKHAVEAGCEVIMPKPLNKKVLYQHLAKLLLH